MVPSSGIWPQPPCIRARENKIIKQNISVLRLYFDFPAMCLPAKAKAVMWFVIEMKFWQTIVDFGDYSKPSWPTKYFYVIICHKCWTHLFCLTEVNWKILSKVLFYLKGMAAEKASFEDQINSFANSYLLVVLALVLKELCYRNHLTCYHDH